MTHSQSTNACGTQFNWSRMEKTTKKFSSSNNNKKNKVSSWNKLLQNEINPIFVISFYLTPSKYDSLFSHWKCSLFFHSFVCIWIALSSKTQINSSFVWINNNSNFKLFFLSRLVHNLRHYLHVIKNLKENYDLNNMPLI